MVEFVGPGMRVKCIGWHRKQYGWVGTVRLYKEGLVTVEFDNGDQDQFRREDLRDVTPRRLGRGA